ncbi:MAG: 4-carboxy-4-hydroxy-2-oxoadipate aldolase/oxaloacetate decarboxylase [Spirochaetales bacterium]|nr:4-carboxy-4-hydroxy-2-oxoadipate aldolase/oxaloacetate decarboxylase [Spirochaetales bacterium]
MDQYENLMILDYPKPDPKLIEAFREVSVASAHECMDRTNYLSPAIHQYYPGMKLCGPALTVRCQPLDNLTIHAAMHIAKPGDVMVVTMGGNPNQGPFGDCCTTLAVQRKMGGLVIDTGIRDGENIQHMGFPIFCCGHSVTGTIKKEFGSVNHPISIGGQIVRPGDIMLGDDDGVVVIPLERAEEVLEKALKRQADEVIVRDKFSKGTSAWELGNWSEYCKKAGYKLPI